LGSVFKRKRKDARAQNWYVEYSYGGKRIRKLARGARTKSEAKAYLREIERQIDRGEYIPRKRKDVLFEVFADYYLKWAKVNKLSWERDRIFLDHLVPFFKGMMLQQITPMLIEDFKRRRKEKVSGSTVNKEVSCLRHMLNMAIDERFITENPVRKVRFFPEHNKKERILNEREIMELLKYCNERIRPIIIIALNTGMRRGEILNLRWQNVDLYRKFISVEKTKSGRTRKIPMNSLVEKILRNLSLKKVNDEYVFWNRRTGKPVQDLKKAFKSACKKAGIDNLRFHDLRHTFATKLVENGVDIVTVSELLGHSSLRMTMRYSHPSPEHKRDAVENLVKIEEKKSAELLTELLTERHARVSKRQILNKL
jgi:integrase